MKRELIFASVLMIFSINLTAQDNISGHKVSTVQTGIDKPAMENELALIPEINQSMSNIARETLSGPGKGTIVSNQARLLGSAKRQNMNKENAGISIYKSQNRNRKQMHASPNRRNPDLIALNTARGAHRSSFHGRK
jgi:hypothetical protein